MFQAPLRLLATLRPQLPAGVLVATAVSTIVFSSTPFLVSGVAREFEVDVASVGIISTVQLLGFSLATWTAGRFMRPRRRAMVIAVMLGIAANVGSGLVPWFSLLVSIRFVSGISLGLFAWIAWAEAFGHSEKTGDVAVIGPIVGTLAAPVAATVIDGLGVREWFIALAVLHLVPLAFIHGTRFEAVDPGHRKRHRPTPAAAVILVALGVLTMGGSAVFVFLGEIGQDRIKMSAVVMSLAFSANALAGIPSARYRGARRHPSLWMGVTAACGIAAGTVHHVAVFWIAIPLWGFAFWMGVPGAFALLAARSNYPNERAGDAQAVMAAGRVVGPLLGGAAYAADPHLLGLIGGGVMVMGTVLLLSVEFGARSRIAARLAVSNP